MRDVHVITLRPPPNYIGFRTAWLEQLGYINRFIDTESLPSRNSRKRATKTQLYETYFKLLGFWADGPILPFYCDSRGYIAVKKKELDNDPDAFEAWKMVDDAYRVTVADGQSFKVVDGDNAQRMLDDMMQDVASPYRHALIMSNLTKTDVGKLQARNAIMKWPCFEQGLLIIEYSYKYLRVTWNKGAHSWSTIEQALNPEGQEGITDKDLRLFMGIDTDVRKSRPRGEEDENEPVLANGAETAKTEFKSSWTNINHMYSFLERYRRIINRPIRTVCLAGEIGGRGVRYKGVKHEGILTDMFLSFDVSKKKQIALHGETLIQYAGRLCGIYDIKAYPNVAGVPEVKLWIPDDCLQVLMRNLAFITDFVQMMAQRRPDETYIDMCHRILSDVGLRSRFPTAEQVLLHATGRMGNGRLAFVNPTRPNIMNPARRLIHSGVDAVPPGSEINRWTQELSYLGDAVSTTKPLHIAEAHKNLQRGFEGLEELNQQQGTLRRGPGAPIEPYILHRVEAINGMPVHVALASNFPLADGTLRQYSKEDLKYDLKCGHLILDRMPQLDLGGVSDPDLVKCLLAYVLYVAGPEGLPFDARLRLLHPVSRTVTCPMPQRLAITPPSILVQCQDAFGACFELDLENRLRLDDDYFKCDPPDDGAQSGDTDADSESPSEDESSHTRKRKRDGRSDRLTLPSTIGEVLDEQLDYMSRTDLYEVLKIRLAHPLQVLGSPSAFGSRMRAFQQRRQDDHATEDGEFNFMLPTGKKVHCRSTAGGKVEYRAAT